ncbi:tripartite motif-containing protein 12A-like [Monodelphis domestica]|uniref:tripartite motif-containing protein 12A-like n=1 Tax=Monodelphis domestica TaxID=13616 RepID=UPI000443664D|nr:tripartite motif-containing protein 12A-like [Monodelphis domestica]
MEEPSERDRSILGLYDSLLISLQNLLTCPVCKSYYSKPITLFSGRTICQACIPLGCLPIHIKTDWRIQNIANLVKVLKPSLEEPQPVSEEWCLRHDEPFTLLCEEDKQRICRICKFSILHRGHTLTQLQDPEACLEVSPKKRRT